MGLWLFCGFFCMLCVIVSNLLFFMRLVLFLRFSFMSLRMSGVEFCWLMCIMKILRVYVLILILKLFCVVLYGMFRLCFFVSVRFILRFFILMFRFLLIRLRLLLMVWLIGLCCVVICVMSISSFVLFLRVRFLLLSLSMRLLLLSLNCLRMSLLLLMKILSMCCGRLCVSNDLWLKKYVGDMSIFWCYKKSVLGFEYLVVLVFVVY